MQLAFALTDPNLRCARCSADVGERDDPIAPPLLCYFCYAPLCPACLEQRDHCGHEEMDLVDEIIAHHRRGHARFIERFMVVFLTVEELRDTVDKARARALIPT